MKFAYLTIKLVKYYSFLFKTFYNNNSYLHVFCIKYSQYINKYNFPTDDDVTEIDINFGTVLVRNVLYIFNHVITLNITRFLLLFFFCVFLPTHIGRGCNLLLFQETVPLKC